ncbi:hypothetical protein EVAR_79956_1 [Eumeta japonica]|uniref:Uncharacterized protein n=1 Tax=Eumeta variegata TaxID=151549 RepID=A0A4C1Y4G6_EUMVA|nr:hypothetical protein EVAR_79956_1 [Eumeta japonica]
MQMFERPTWTTPLRALGARVRSTDIGPARCSRGGDVLGTESSTRPGPMTPQVARPKTYKKRGSLPVRLLPVQPAPPRVGTTLHASRRTPPGMLLFIHYLLPVDSFYIVHDSLNDVSNDREALREIVLRADAIGIYSICETF